ncbi:MAG: hypothetical protein EOP06_04255 [Proteobacteria bacterium]|nr:MAG: hypothetical protein EOP06_04255 [Pseudomonadota bacterium]
MLVQPTSVAVGTWVERFLAAVILVGIVYCAIHAAQYGYLPAPFFFVPSDTFADWFNTAFWARRSDAYETWATIYPPLSFVFIRYLGIDRCYPQFRPFDPSAGLAARDCDWLGLVVMGAIFVLNVVLTWKTFRKIDVRTAPMRTICLALGMPMLNGLERGNLLLIAYTCVLLAAGPLLSSARLRWLFAGLAINFKVYLIASFVETLEDRDPSLAQIVLDSTRTTLLLSEWLPLLYGMAQLTDRTMMRMHAALEISPIKEFRLFGKSRIYDSIPFDALHSFIHAVCERPGGMPVALELVSCRLHNWSRKEPLEQADQWASTIRKILKNYSLVEDRSFRPHANMEVLLKIACTADEGLEIIQRLCRDLLMLVKGHREDIYQYGEVLQALITTQPLAVLKEFFEGDPAILDTASDLIQRFRCVERDVFGAVPSSILKSWCDVAPDVRYPLVASMIHLLHKTKPHELYEWNSNAMMLLSNAPETEAVLQELFHALDAQCLEGDQLSVLHTQRELVRKLGCSRISSLDHFILKIAQLDELIARFPDAPQIGGFE